MPNFQELNLFNISSAEEFSSYHSSGSDGTAFDSDGYPLEEDLYLSDGIPLANERIPLLITESPSLENRAALLPSPDDSAMLGSLECQSLHDAVFDPRREHFPNLPPKPSFPAPIALHLQFEAPIQTKKQKLVPQAKDVLIPLAQLSNERATRAIAMAVERAHETKEAQFIKGREFGLSRSLMVTGSGDIYVLFNRKKQGDSPLGKGRFKNVSAALNLKTGKVVAFLSIKKEGKDDLDRNRREYALASSLNAGVIPNSFIDRGTKAAWLAEAMDGDLEKGIRNQTIGLDSEEKRLGLALQMLDQLSDFHDLGIVHMDVKPANMLYSQDSEGNCSVFLGDLGLSIIDPSQKILLGTARFLSPESIYVYYNNGNPNSHPKLPENYVTPKHDSWAMGISLLAVFKKYLDLSFLTDNPKVEQVLTKSNAEIQELIWNYWYLCQLTQEKWMAEPENKESLEFVIWNLLRVDPTERWTPKQAAFYIRSLQRRKLFPATGDNQRDESPMSYCSLSSSSSFISPMSLSSINSSSSSSSYGSPLSRSFTNSPGSSSSIDSNE